MLIFIEQRKKNMIALIIAFIRLPRGNRWV
jgi:hypothetical protein